ncbi:MAG: NAD-binding protein [Chloroflexota bacterium]|nr:NAD-binding protein [Chloroflexota bacterium]
MAAYTALQTLALIFQEQMQLTRLHFFSDHTVICGLGRKGFRLAQGFRQRGERVVVIERDEENDLIEAARAEGVVVLTGDATRSELLRRARVHTARRLIAVCGDDGVNAEVGVHSAELTTRRTRTTLQCILHVTNPQLCALLREREIESGGIDGFRLDLFNVFNAGARTLLNEYPAFDEASTRPPHVLVVGLGRMGENVVVQMAKRWARCHQARGQPLGWLRKLWSLLRSLWTGKPATGAGRLRLTVVDWQADQRIESLRLRYPRLSEACHLVPVSIDVHGPAFQRAEFLFNARGQCDISTMFVCLDDDSLGLSTALTLRQHVLGRDIPIVVRTEQDAGLARLVEGIHPGDRSFENLHAFPLLDRTCTPDQLLAGTHEIIARAIHEGYLGFQSEPAASAKPCEAGPSAKPCEAGPSAKPREAGPSAKPREAGPSAKPCEAGPATVPWDQLSEEYRESCRRQADHIGHKLTEVGCALAPLTDWSAETLEFKPEEVEIVARMEHERWMAQRIRDDWTCGPRDDEARTNPNLVPWEDLPEDIKGLNRDMVRSLPASLAQVGLQVYRTNRARDHPDSAYQQP